MTYKVMSDRIEQARQQAQAESKSAYEIAKAKLFIGRSLLELKKYREALNYLILPEVAEHFPKECQFWRQYVISRLR